MTTPAIAPPDLRQHMLDVAKSLMLEKGFTAVGLTELLAVAKIPKGSFYHYFASKEAFGDALLTWYFTAHHAQLDVLLGGRDPAARRLMRYWQYWLDTQTGGDPDQRCLAVKLSAEVSDLSESMRATLEWGTRGIIERVTRCLAEGKADQSLRVTQEPAELAATLYQLWLGGSLMAKISRHRGPLDTTMASTRRLLELEDAAG